MKKLFSLFLMLSSLIATSQHYTGGCSDPAASNYVHNENQFEYGDCCYENALRVIISGAGHAIIDNPATYTSTIFEGYEYLPNQFGCFEDGCYNVELTAFGFTEFYFELSDGQTFVYNLTDEIVSFQFTVGEIIEGCINSTACNYNPESNCEGECLFDCWGCTFPEASNYNPSATMNDGSCIVDTYTLSVSAECDYLFTNDGFLTNQISGTTVDGMAQFSMNGGCNFLQIFPVINSTPTSYSITNESGNIISEGTIESNQYIAEISLCGDHSIGCKDVNACNYDPEAYCATYQTCSYECYGCTDPNALNFEASATLDNGTCCNDYLYIEASLPIGLYISEYEGHGLFSNSNESITELCYGGRCVRIRNSEISIYEPFSVSIYNVDGQLLHTEQAVESGYEGFVLYEIDFTYAEEYVFGCDDEFACNYNPNVNCFDYSCDYSCHGCTDPEAPNYNPNATIENGSCCTDSWFTLEFSEPCFWYVSNIGIGLVAYGNYPEQNGFCSTEFSTPISWGLSLDDDHSVPSTDRSNDDCFVLQAYGISGNLLEYTLYDNNGETISSSSAVNGLVNADLATNFDDVSGCMNLYACNYNPNATCHSGNCLFECGGCTDVSAINYSSVAQWEDGSCFYTIESPEVTYQIVNSEDGLSYWIVFTIVNLGNGEQYIISNDYNSMQIIASNVDSYEMGPFACSSQVNFKLRSIKYNLIEYLEIGPISHDCSILSVNVTETEDSFGLFPNPTKGLLTITGLADVMSDVLVYDMTGRVVLEITFQQTTDLDVKDLSPGYYIIRVKNKGKMETLSFIKE